MKHIFKLALLSFCLFSMQQTKPMGWLSSIVRENPTLCAIGLVGGIAGAATYATSGRTYKKAVRKCVSVEETTRLEMAPSIDESGKPVRTEQNIPVQTKKYKSQLTPFKKHSIKDHGFTFATYSLIFAATFLAACSAYVKDVPAALISASTALAMTYASETSKHSPEKTFVQNVLPAGVVTFASAGLLYLAATR